MALSWSQFQAYATDFIERSRALGDDWELVRRSDRIGGSYLRKPRVLAPPPPPRPDPAVPVESLGRATLDGPGEDEFEPLGELEESEEEHEIDDGALEVSPQDAGAPAAHQYEYHVVYHPAYRVPVLYFRARHLDGRTLRLNEVMSDIDEADKRAMAGGTTAALTQAEHPVLGQPFYELHPCRTAEVMAAYGLAQTQSGDTDGESGSEYEGSSGGPCGGGAAASHHQEGAPLTGQNYLVTWVSAMGRTVGLHLPAEYALLPGRTTL